MAGSIGAYVAKVNPKTLEPVWYNQLINTSVNGEWDYPGSMVILNDGYLYVSYGYRLAKLNPDTGKVLQSLSCRQEEQNQKILPLMVSMPHPTAPSL